MKYKIIKRKRFEIYDVFQVKICGYRIFLDCFDTKDKAKAFVKKMKERDL